MIPSGLDIAIDLAARGANVLYVCHSIEVGDVLHVAEKDGAVKDIRRVNGLEEIWTINGGRIIVRRPENPIRGQIFDAVFAPPSVWDDERRKVGLLALTNGSRFFEPLNPPIFSTLQRLEADHAS